MRRELRHLFDADGSLALEVALRAQPLLAFDFDGTLAPIVARPADARISAGMAQRLTHLAALRPIAIVTGRAVEDVSSRLGFRPRYVVGNHGAEEWGQATGLDPGPLRALRALIELHAESLRAEGVEIEDKGYSLALHYRLAREPARIVRHLQAMLSGLPPTLRCVPGKCVLDVVLSDAPDKGDAVSALMRRSGCGALVFVGDDITDEAVFIDALPGWLTVRVGREDPGSRAAFFLDGHAEVANLLDRMLGSLGHR